MKSSPILPNGEIKSREDYVNEAQAIQSQNRSLSNSKKIVKLIESIMK